MHENSNFGTVPDSILHLQQLGDMLMQIKGKIIQRKMNISQLLSCIVSFFVISLLPYLFMTQKFQNLLYNKLY